MNKTKTKWKELQLKELIDLWKTRRNIKKKNEFKINLIFDEKGEELEKVVERAFGNYCLKKLEIRN